MILVAFVFLFSSTWAASVTIDEYGGYQDPFSGAFAANTWPLLQAEYESQIELTFKHFPLSFHQYGMKAAEAAECARDQGKFEDYHFTLFQHQEALDEDSLRKYAMELKLNTEQFNDCLANGEKKSIIDQHLAEGIKQNVSGTPTFFINGKMLVGAQSYSVFKEMIDEILGKEPPVGKDQQAEPIIGNAKASVQILTFFDYSSPFVQSFYTQTMPLIREAYPEKVKFVFRNFPLSFYSNDYLAAEAGECAHSQKKFEVFTNQAMANPSDSLQKSAENAGLKIETFNSCLDSHTFEAEVLHDFETGEKEHVKGTPTFFISGPNGNTSIVGAQTYADFKHAIEFALGNNSEDSIDSTDPVPQKADETPTNVTPTTCLEGDKKSYTCVDETEISWCDCVGREWRCITNPDQSCPRESACDGCMMNDSCIAIGTRMEANGAPSFCGLETTLEVQKKDGAACQNNFECLSNMCNTGLCINLQAEIKETRNVVQQLLDWLSNLFGR